MTYTFRCKNGQEFDLEFSFKEFDEIKSGDLIVPCESCEKCQPELVMGGQNCFVWFSDPKTLGTLAERNAKYRIPQAEEEAEKKREKKIAAGKYVEPKQIDVPWEKPEQKVDMKERREKRNEHIAKNKSSGRSPRIKPSNIFKNK